jgi:hypothetical protein
MFHDFVSKMSLNGCAGDLTKKENDAQLEFFIPYRDCPDMILRFNFNNGGWQRFGAMFDFH